MGKNGTEVVDEENQRAMFNRSSGKTTPFDLTILLP